MSRYGGRYKIVPVMERLVEDDLVSEPVLKRVAHLPASLIGFVNNLGKDLQSGSCHGVCGPAAGVCDGVERRSAPGTRYLGEEPVLDGVGAAHPCFLSAMPAGAPPILPQKQASRSYLILPTRFMKRSAL